MRTPKNRLLDSVEVLEPWVEKGRAPDRIVGAHFAGGPHIAKPDRTPALVPVSSSREVHGLRQHGRGCLVCKNGVLA